MPQFDKITFFNQIFWFLLAFFSFYFLVLKSVLPVIASSLKTRKKIINSMLSVSSSLNETSSKKSYAKHLQKFLKAHKRLFDTMYKKKVVLAEKSRLALLKKSLFN
jgi:F0F1-type ATP synthase membrane subunit b/b'